MYYALFDWEHPKITFMKNALLYKIGLDKTEYGTKIFIEWVLMGFWHGLIIYYACLMVLNDIHIHKSDG